MELGQPSGIQYIDNQEHLARLPGRPQPPTSADAHRPFLPVLLFVAGDQWTEATLILKVFLLHAPVWSCKETEAKIKQPTQGSTLKPQNPLLFCLFLHGAQDTNQEFAFDLGMVPSSPNAFWISATKCSASILKNGLLLLLEDEELLTRCFVWGSWHELTDHFQVPCPRLSSQTGAWETSLSWLSPGLQSVPGPDQQHHSYKTSAHVAWGDFDGVFQGKISL